MTIEEAIDIVKCLAWHDLRPSEEDIEQAIKALEQEPCEMTADDYRQRMIQAFHNADCDELIALVVLPTEKEFEHLGWLLEKHYKAKPEPCTDAISRQAAIEAFGLSENTRKYGGNHSGYNTMMLYEIQDTLEDLPPVTPTPKMGRWIPVSERLPEENEYNGDVCKYYLIQDEYEDMHVAHYKKIGWIPMCQLKALGDKVVAWMPLPEPYKTSPTGTESEG